MKPCKHIAAFSLVETAIALGILSFSLIAIMGLVPVALQASRDSIDRSTELHMLQTVRANLISLPYSGLPAQGTFYFDADGMDLGGPGPPGETRYRIDFTNQQSTVFPGNQTATKLITSNLEITNLVTGASQTDSIHLPDNGF